MSDELDIISRLPLKKNATPAQIIMLFVVAALLVGTGWKASSSVKDYFDDNHRQLVALLSAQDAKVLVVSAKADKNAEGIDALRRYGWSNSDMQRWAQQLERANRIAVPALVVPDVPAPASQR